MISRLLIMMLFATLMWGCGKVGPLSLPEDKLDKSIITYPCDEECQKNLKKKKNAKNQ